MSARCVLAAPCPPAPRWSCTSQTGALVLPQRSCPAFTASALHTATPTPPQVHTYRVSIRTEYSSGPWTDLLAEATAAPGGAAPPHAPTRTAEGAFGWAGAGAVCADSAALEVRASARNGAGRATPVANGRRSSRHLSLAPRGLRGFPGLGWCAWGTARCVRLPFSLATSTGGARGRVRSPSTWARPSRRCTPCRPRCSAPRATRPRLAGRRPTAAARPSWS